MTIPTTLTTADVLRLLPALEKFSPWAAYYAACSIDGSEKGNTTVINNGKIIIKRVTIPSEVVTRELGATWLKDGKLDVSNDGYRTAIIISTEPKE